MSAVESRPMRYFVAVAEELNFARAAERVGIAPPALSRAIAGLEHDLGVRLFDRSTRHVELTEAGRTLLTGVRPALGALDAAALRACRVGAEGPRIGVMVKADVEGGLLEPVLEAYEAEADSVPVEVVFAGWGDQPRLLRSGEADVAIVVEPFDVEGLDSETVLKEEQVLALPSSHPLADRPRLSMADVRAGHRPVADGAHVYVPAGDSRPSFSDMVQMIRQIELGHMIALLPRSLADRHARPGLVWRTVDDAPDARFAVAWPSGSRSRAVAAFVRVAAAVAAERSSAAVPAAS